MKRFLLVLTLSTLPAWSGAEEPTPPGIPAATPAVAPTPDVAAPVTGPVVRSQSSPIDLMAQGGTAMTAEERARRTQLTAAMHQELTDLHQRTLEQVLDLSARAEKASTDEASLDVQRDIAQLKQNEQVQSLRIQARYAREVGSEELAAEIDAAVAFLLDPVLDTTAADRAPRPRPER